MSVGQKEKNQLHNSNEPQEMSDFRSILAFLEQNDTTQIATELSDDARNRRELNEALARAVESQDGSSENSSWKEHIEKNAYKIFRRQLHVLWPLFCKDVPAPPELLSDEIATSAERLTHGRDHKDNLCPLKSREVGQIWMAVQWALYHILTMLGWTFPSYMPTAMLQKEVERMSANPKSYKPEALRSVLSYYHWNMDRLPRPHTIAWRDILAVALGSNDATLVSAAEKALKTLEELYNGQAYEAKLEKRTWTLRSNAPLLERARLLREARENCPSVRLMDYIDESLDDDHILSPMISQTLTPPTGNDMLLSDSHERPWLSDVDELYASLVWHSDSDDEWNMSDDDEIPSDLPPPDEPAQSSDSSSESQDEDTSSESSEGESSSTSESSTELSESDANTESDNSAEEVASSLKRPSQYPLPPTKRMRPDDPA